ncbi:hypothetical protein NIASO_13975 [Niabella soli DSM 19437]|uniref:Uncharacterized protein n=1 Tax=Niabella soli DSM 19437 TaxID=929713 RepID=W0F8J1_9BACT|nr:hypothetical protein NIASO_13975 [Niabella soli DSM 19437]
MKNPNLQQLPPYFLFLILHFLFQSGIISSGFVPSEQPIGSRLEQQIIWCAVGTLLKNNFEPYSHPIYQNE